MRIIASMLFALSLVVLSGCGCMENLSGTVAQPGSGIPDATQPGWHQCLFGTRRVPMHPGDRSFELKEADPQQTDWDRFLHGTRFVPRGRPVASFPSVE